MKFAIFAVLALVAVAHSFVLLPQEAERIDEEYLMKLHAIEEWINNDFLNVQTKELPLKLSQHLAPLLRDISYAVESGLQLNGNVIDNIVEEIAEFIKKFLKQNEPLALPDLGEQSIVDSDVNIKVTLSNVKLSKADDFVLKDAESNLSDLSAKFELVAPSPHLEGDFKVSGTAFTKTVSGSGTFSVDLTNMDQKGNIQLGLKDHGVYVQKLDLDYDLNDAKFTFTGLTVDGMTPDQVNEFFNKQLLNTLNQNKAKVCEKVAAQVVEKVNSLISGKSLKELIEWLKNFIPQ